MTLKIAFWILIGYIISIILGRILTYSSAILHNWCMMVLYDGQYWFNKGTRIKNILQKISNGDNFKTVNEIKFIPLVNIFGPLLWFIFGELLFLLFIILILIIKLIIFIIVVFDKFIYKPFLSKIFKPVFKFCKWLYSKISNFFHFFITIFKYIKEYILNLKIA